VNLGVLLLAIASGFAIGSIPFGVIVAGVFYRTDIRAAGSGNIGAANALRTLGAAGGAAVLLLDALKGLAPTMLALRLGPTIGVACASSAILGHCFSPWLRFRGGKGVATALGTLIALSWAAAIASVVVWVATVRLTRYSSVASLAACAVSPISLWFLTGNVSETLYGAAATLFIVWTHRENIARLRAGSEHTLNLGRRAAGSKGTQP
jgi:glycerol-3-phosphate acyltransferase PlsY